MSKLKQIKIISIISLLLISTGVFARGITYDYVGAGYASYTDSSLGFDLNGSAFMVGGSYSLAPKIAITASYVSDTYDRYLGYKLSGSTLSVGITAHTSISPSADIFGNFSVLNADAKVDYYGATVLSDSDTGNEVTVGLRTMASDQIELGLSGSRTDLFGDTNNSFSINASYYVNDKVVVGVGYSSSNNVDGYIVNVIYILK